MAGAAETGMTAEVSCALIFCPVLIGIGIVLFHARGYLTLRNMLRYEARKFAGGVRSFQCY